MLTPAQADAHARLLALGKNLTTHEAADALGKPLSSTLSMLRRIERAGWALEVGRGPGHRAREHVIWEVRSERIPEGGDVFRAKRDVLAALGEAAFPATAERLASEVGLSNLHTWRALALLAADDKVILTDDGRWVC